MNFPTFAIHFSYYLFMKLSYLILFCAIVFSGMTLRAQEIRVQGHMQALGYINGAFGGYGAGLESPIGKKFSLNFDVNWGKNEAIKSTEFKPSVRYYFGKNQIGFYAGPSLKYIKLKSTGQKRDPQYTYGLDIGAKTWLFGPLNFGVNLSPHIAFEDNGSGVSGQVSIGLEF
jgi:hypothetical protein